MPFNVPQEARIANSEYLLQFQIPPEERWPRLTAMIAKVKSALSCFNPFRKTTKIGPIARFSSTDGHYVRTANQPLRPATREEKVSTFYGPDKTTALQQAREASFIYNVYG